MKYEIEEPNLNNEIFTDIIELPLATKPNEVNRNGYMYDKDEFDKAIKQFTDDKDRTLYITDDNQPTLVHEENLKFITVDMSKVIGTIFEIDTDTKIAKCQVNMQKLKEINKVLPYYDGTLSNVLLGMRYTANIDKDGNGNEIVKDMKIVCFDIIYNHFLDKEKEK